MPAHKLDPRDPSGRPPKALRIREARIAKGLTQDQVARAMGVIPTTVSRWERGTLEPRGEQLERLAALLDRTPRWFDYGDEPRPHTEPLDVVPPQFDEWMRTSPLASDLTDQERKTLEGFRFPYGHPGVGFYDLALYAYRKGTLGVSA